MLSFFTSETIRIKCNPCPAAPAILRESRDFIFRISYENDVEMFGIIVEHNSSLKLANIEIC